MRQWDLTTGAAKLDEALDSLKKATARIVAQWDDDTLRKFENTYLAPLEPRVRRALDAVHRLAQVAARAERDCGSY